MRVGEIPGPGAFVEFSRKISELSRENVEANARRLEEAVQRGRELQNVQDLTRTTNLRLDRNVTDIQSTIERARTIPGLAVGGTVDIRA